MPFFSQIVRRLGENYSASAPVVMYIHTYMCIYYLGCRLQSFGAPGLFFFVRHLVSRISSHSSLEFPVVFFLCPVSCQNTSGPTPGWSRTRRPSDCCASMPPCLARLWGSGGNGSERRVYVFGGCPFERLVSREPHVYCFVFVGGCSPVSPGCFPSNRKADRRVS